MSGCWSCCPPAADCTIGGLAITTPPALIPIKPINTAVVNCFPDNFMLLPPHTSLHNVQDGIRPAYFIS